MLPTVHRALLRIRDLPASDLAALAIAVVLVVLLALVRLTSRPLTASDAWVLRAVDRSARWLTPALPTRDPGSFLTISTGDIVLPGRRVLRPVRVHGRSWVLVTSRTGCTELFVSPVDRPGRIGGCVYGDVVRAAQPAFYRPEPSAAVDVPVSYVRTPRHSPGGMTVEVWTQPEQPPAHPQRLLRVAVPQYGVVDVALLVSRTAVTATATCPDGVTPVVAGPPVPAGEWTQLGVEVSCRTDRIDLFESGRLVRAAALVFGAAPAAATCAIDCAVLRDLAVYPHALSANEWLLHELVGRRTFDVTRSAG